MKKKKLLLSALLAVSIGAMPAIGSDSEVLSDDELEDVSAQGLQTIRNGNQLFSNATPGYLKGSVQRQDNNLDSVQIRNSAQANAAIQGLSNSAQSSLNTNANFLDTNDSNFANTFEQSNSLTAKNHSNEADGDVALASNINKQRQYVETGFQGNSPGTVVTVIKGQNNNNNSIQMRDNAQRDINGIMVFNASTSAGNAGFNFATLGTTLGNGTQTNIQNAKNFDNLATGGNNAVAVNAEIMDNTDIADIQTWTDPEDTTQVEGNPTQYIKNVYGHSGRPVYQYTYIENQDNNNNSVQSRDNVQQRARLLHQENIAKTSANFGINSISLSSPVSDQSLTQTNEQRASSHENEANADFASGDALAANVNKETQWIDNMLDPENLGPENGQIVSQNNNNNSVQYTGNVQRNAEIGFSNNASLSAINTGINEMYLDSASGMNLTQTNDQGEDHLTYRNGAYNFNNTASGYNAYAGNVENTDRPNQSVMNGYVDIGEQNNNSNSVQFKDNVQESMSSTLVSNAANSAANYGLNQIVVEGTIVGSIVTQNNTQVAYNHVNDASATNDATAANVNKETQYVENMIDIGARTGDIENQDNNNNSVQYTGNVQRNADIYLLNNTALSAMNTGVNLISAGSIDGCEVNQTNEQEASNFDNFASGSDASAYNSETSDYPNQTVFNDQAVITEQNNNNNSVQLKGYAQQNIDSFLVSNASNSAANNGANLILLNGNLQIALVTQLNQQTASNHDNFALASSDASAENVNKETQYVKTMEEDPSGYEFTLNGEQNNNNNSVQLTNNAQQNAEIYISVNSAISAINTGANAVFSEDNTADITQTNDQESTNMNNTAISDEYAYAGNVDGSLEGYNQAVINNGGNLNGNMSNNNNSVQLIDNAQRNMHSVLSANVVNSASNFGANMVVLDSDLTGNLNNGDLDSLYIEQANEQDAYNHFNTALGDVESQAYNVGKESQHVSNQEDFYIASGVAQYNNNNSVQIGDNAQRNARMVLAQNAALSGINTGFNLISMASGTSNTTDEILQSNTQTAYNFKNVAGDATSPSDEAYAYNYDGGDFFSPSHHDNQLIENTAGEIDGFQGNMNNSVFLSGNAQGNMQFVAAVNSANSAVNAGLNVLADSNLSPLGFSTAGDTTGTDLFQTNNQVAVNHENEAYGENVAVAVNGNKETQKVEIGSGFDISEGIQCNANNSIKITGNAQSNAQGLMLANVANSALNFGINMINVTSATGATISQTNIGTARNWTNTAISTGTAVAGNINW